MTVASPYLFACVKLHYYSNYSRPSQVQNETWSTNPILPHYVLAAARLLFLFATPLAHISILKKNFLIRWVGRTNAGVWTHYFLDIQHHCSCNLFEITRSGHYEIETASPETL